METFLPSAAEIGVAGDAPAAFSSWQRQWLAIYIIVAVLYLRHEGIGVP